SSPSCRATYSLLSSIEPPSLAVYSLSLHDALPIYQSDLLAEVPLAGIDLNGLGVAISRWPTFEDVGDVNGLPRDPDLGEQLVQQVSRPADERLALEILVPPRRLADEHQSRVGPSHTEHDVGPSLCEPTGGARLGLTA